ncbi:MAG: Asp-tRNA(Asn)/Glu-tRNA(Gln) amidotransferase subunit GatB [Coriobacteriia bacterium]|nr:Asp-tRNA(Asn)/Glu-tRNA(Gln) amidotransferase subunit GatB [Coriobacteriia bacterium]
MADTRLTEALERYEAVIGLEIHTEITVTQTKMFCGCPVAFGGEPNTRTCPTCLGHPGALPVPNEEAIAWTVLAGLATACTIAPWSQFHRKNYFYPDMPANYQISQFEPPFCADGRLDIELTENADERLDVATAANCTPLDEADRAGGYRATIGITRLHLEEDTGKMNHIGGADGRIAGATHSLVDFNRAGTPLMELVTEPDIRTPEEARAFARKLRLIWLSLGVSDCNMEEGSMRVDANISIRPRGVREFGTKTELKNMNSFKGIHDGLAYEIIRQAAVLDEGGTVVQETRHWDASAKVTSAMRSKETADDYRYFPEPDTVPFEFSSAYVDAIAARLPELPDARRERITDTFGLSMHDAGVLAVDTEMLAFFEETVAAAGVEVEGIEVKGVAQAVINLMLNDLAAHLNAEDVTLAACRITPAHIAELVVLVNEDTISSKQAKEVFAEMAASGELPTAIVEARGLKQVSDTGELEAIVDTLIAAHEDKVAEYRAGKTGLLGFFVGQVMRETGGQANPKVVNEILAAKLA